MYTNTIRPKTPLYLYIYIRIVYIYNTYTHILYCLYKVDYIGSCRAVTDVMAFQTGCKAESVNQTLQDIVQTQDDVL